METIVRARLPRRLLPLALALLSAAGPAPAQSGDHPGEDQPPLPPDLAVPPAPVRTPAEERATFVLAPGFAIDLVAAEPLVEDPVAASFGADGRLWVVEMRSYMPDADGAGEDRPDGRIAVLEDRDGDGRMDRRTVFLDGLVLPRAVGFLADGVLVGEPPRLWFCRDRDGDGAADAMTAVAHDFAGGNPEHAPNGPLRALDNWTYVANYASRFRVADGRLIRGETVWRGQWGLSQDDAGRLYHDTNSDQLRADLLPAESLTRNPHLADPAGVNARIARDQRVWPVRITPGVNRGYLPGFLAGWKLKDFTAACAPHVYRGALFPEEFRGCAFVCEPAAHLVRCNRVTERDGRLSATNYYDRAEFLASTDERFRPVNLFGGPDGALYVVDLYRGLIQHRTYVTTYLRRQVEARGLATPLHRGRIWRIVPEPAIGRGGRPRAPSRRPRTPGLERAGVRRLVEALGHPDGWWRDTAQRLLVDRRADAAVPLLRRAVRGGAGPLGRLHALWTLEGIGTAGGRAVAAPETAPPLDRDTLGVALGDPDARVRAAAVRLAEPLLRAGDPEWTARLAALAADPDPRVLLQLALSLGESRAPAAEEAQAALLDARPDDALMRDAVLSGLAGREAAFAARLGTRAGWSATAGGRAETLRALARCVASATAAEAAAPAPAGDPRRLAAGRTGYVRHCSACHLMRGQGRDGLAPPLAGSEWVRGSEARLARIVVAGLTGPIEVAGKAYNLDMPGLGTLDDATLADILTYIRASFGNAAPPVGPEAVAAARATPRSLPWTASELAAIPLP